MPQTERDELLDKFSELLKNKRKASSLTQEQLATLLAITPAHVQKLEAGSAGDGRLPSRGLLDRIVGLGKLKINENEDAIKELRVRARARATHDEDVLKTRFEWTLVGGLEKLPARRKNQRELLPVFYRRAVEEAIEACQLDRLCEQHKIDLATLDVMDPLDPDHPVSAQVGTLAADWATHRSHLYSGPYPIEDYIKNDLPRELPISIRLTKTADLKDEKDSFTVNISELQEWVKKIKGSSSLSDEEKLALLDQATAALVRSRQGTAYRGSPTLEYLAARLAVDQTKATRYFFFGEADDLGHTHSESERNESHIAYIPCRIPTFSNDPCWGTAHLLSKVAVDDAVIDLFSLILVRVVGVFRTIRLSEAVAN